MKGFALRLDLKQRRKWGFSHSVRGKLGTNRFIFRQNLSRKSFSLSSRISPGCVRFKSCRLTFSLACVEGVPFLDGSVTCDIEFRMFCYVYVTETAFFLARCAEHIVYLIHATWLLRFFMIG